jgi:hypothetical protein
MQNEKQALLQALKSIKELVELLNLITTNQELTKITKDIEGLNSNKPQNLETAIQNLEQIVTVKTDKNGQQLLLLHRLMSNFERSKDSPATHTTDKPTEWVAEVGVAQLRQERSEADLKGANPVLSCWIPRSSIQNIINGQDNTGTWGDLGQNPNKNHFKVIVKPGKFEIYEELAQ